MIKIKHPNGRIMTAPANMTVYDFVWWCGLNGFRVKWGSRNA